MALDVTPPSVSTWTYSISTTGNLVFSFSEAIQLGTGSILLYEVDASYNQIGGNIAFSSTINGSALTLDPAASLTSGKTYYIEFRASSILDLAGNDFNYDTATSTTYYSRGYTTTVDGSTPPPPPPPPTGDGTVLFFYGGHTYQVVTTGKTWADASSFAQAQGGYLAIVSSQLENDFILEAAYQQGNPSTMPTAPDGGDAYYVWLGASDVATEGAWKWGDGTSVSAGYTNWGSGSGITEPDNYLNQDGLALALSGWPYDPMANPTSGAIGDAGQWNDINTSNTIYSVIEWSSSRTGTSSDDSLFGGSTADTLNGGAGADLLLGGAGNDLLTGGLGADNISGDAGADTLIFNVAVGTSSDSGRAVLSGANNDIGQDTIAYFGLAEDTIRVVASGVANFVHGTDTAIGSGIGTEVAGNRASFSSSTGLIELNQATNDNWADVGDIAVTFVMPSTTLTEANFEARLQYNLTGTTAANTLTGGRLNDTLSGGDGNDLLTGSAGSDNLSGGAGADTLIVNAVVGSSSESARVVVANTTTSTNNDKGQDTLTSFSLTEDTIRVVATSVSSFVHGTDTTIGAGTGTEVAGDRASFSTATGLIELNQTANNNWADAGDIALTFVTPSVALTETNFEARLQYNLTGTTGANTLTGGRLNDTLSGGDGNDVLTGGAGSDSLNGGTGADTLIFNAVVGSSSDSVRVAVTNTTSSTNNDKGQDTLTSFSLTEDTIRVVASNVTTFVHGTDTTIGAGTGTEVASGDRASFSAATGLIELNQATNNNWSDLGDIAVTFASPSVALSETGFEARLQYSLTGTTGANTLTGGVLSDTLAGGDGNDVLSGGAGNDLLRGGFESDTLWGGSGQDIFRFDTGQALARPANLDLIKDFSVVDDTIQLENSVFTKFGTTTLGTINVANFKDLSLGAQDADDYIVLNKATGALYYDTTGSTNGLTDAVQFATVTLVGTNQTVTNADFVLV